MTEIPDLTHLAGVITCEGIPCLPPQLALELLQNNSAALLDIREEYETNFRLFDVPETFFIRLDQMPAAFADLPTDRLIVVADNVGVYSKKTAQMLREHGFNHAASLIGGMADWCREGFPVILHREYELTGSCSCKLRPRGGDS